MCSQSIKIQKKTIIVKKEMAKIWREKFYTCKKHIASPLSISNSESYDIGKEKETLSFS